MADFGDALRPLAIVSAFKHQRLEDELLKRRLDAIKSLAPEQQIDALVGISPSDRARTGQINTEEQTRKELGGLVIKAFTPGQELSPEELGKARAHMLNLGISDTNVPNELRSSSELRAITLDLMDKHNKIIAETEQAQKHGEYYGQLTSASQQKLPLEMGQIKASTGADLALTAQRKQQTEIEGKQAPLTRMKTEADTLSADASTAEKVTQIKKLNTEIEEIQKGSGKQITGAALNIIQTLAQQNPQKATEALGALAKSAQAQRGTPADQVQSVLQTLDPNGVNALLDQTVKDPSAMTSKFIAITKDDSPEQQRAKMDHAATLAFETFFPLVESQIRADPQYRDLSEAEIQVRAQAQAIATMNESLGPLTNSKGEFIGFKSQFGTDFQDDLASKAQNLEKVVRKTSLGQKKKKVKVGGRVF